MINFFAKRWAKWSYIFNKLRESEMHTLSAKVAERNAELTKAKIAQMTKDADAQEARITEMAEMEEKGFWECEDGHETPVEMYDLGSNDPKCSQCGKPVKRIKRSEMSGQEKYEADKDRKEAERLLAARRAEIGGQEEQLQQQVATGKYFRGQAQSSRTLADNIRKV
jgi:hypothetical protein